MKKLKTRIKAVSKETVFAVIALLLFLCSVPWIRVFFPGSGEVERGGELHVMLSGLAAYGCSFLLVVITIWFCFKTFWDYALHNDEDDDPKDERKSFREDWASVTPNVRLLTFVGSFFALLYLAVSCLKT